MRGVLVAVMLAVAGPAMAEPAMAGGPVVVELFTSQGCSSCPPADAVLLELSRGRADVLPLAFHVTYWNSLGWADPFSSEAATARQRFYARHVDDPQVYTPELVVQGTRAVVGSDRRAVLAAIAAVRPEGPALRGRRAAGDVVVDVGAGSGVADVLLVGFDREHVTPVGRGENGGRTLTEGNIVRGQVRAGGWSGAAGQVRAAAPAGERVAVLVQRADGVILSAALVP